MANQTIYPYGTNGELPTSIGIINDLTTGGVDKALSAEQGKVLGQYIYGGDLSWVSVDLTEYTIRNYGLGAGTSSSNKWTANGKHQIIPVTSGQTIRIQVLTSDHPSQGAFYAFLTNSYTQPTSTSSNVPYATGSSRTWLTVSDGETELVAPSDAAYLCICPKDGNEYVSTWSVKLSTVNGSHIRFNTDEVLGDTKIINDTSTGGEHDVLAAEQGKVLGEQINGKQDKLMLYPKVDKVSWVQRVNGTQTANVLTVLDADEYSCSLVVKNQNSGSRFAMKVNSLEIGTTYNYEFYLFKRVDGNDVPVSTLSGGGAYNSISDSTNTGNIELTRTYDNEHPGRYYGTIKRVDSSGNYWSFALASQTSWLSVDDTLVVKQSRLYDIVNWQPVYDDVPTKDSPNLLTSGAIYDSTISADNFKYELNLNDLYGVRNGFYIHESGVWKTSSTTDACFKRLIPSHTYMLVNLIPNGNVVYSLLKSYQTPTNGGTPDWSSGWDSRELAPAQQSTIFKAPENDSDCYIVFHASKNDGRVVFRLFDITADFDFYNRENDIVYDLRRYAYSGPLIDIKDNEHKISVVQSAQVLPSHQSSASYKRYLFVVQRGTSSFTISPYNFISYGINKETSGLNGVLSATSITISNIESETTSHCNSCCFSGSFYDSDDEFPIFYIAFRNLQSGDYAGRVLWVGYRFTDIVKDSSETITSIAATEVHRIYLPVETEINGLGYTNVVYNDETGDFWGYGRYNTSGSPYTSKMVFTNFGNIGYNGTALTVLSDTDIVESFKNRYSMVNAQGGCIKNNYLMFGQGYNNAGYIYACVVNLGTHEFTRIDLKSLGFTAEPEGAYVRNGSLILTTNNSHSYVITF